jgi:hypothetical protein
MTHAVTRLASARSNGRGFKTLSEDIEPSSEEIKEVYAQFGLAYYLSEMLHRGLCNLYLYVHLPEDGLITRPRVEEHLSAAEETTLGQLVLKLQDFVLEPLYSRLQHAAKRRNFIAHYFWFERIHLLKSRKGVMTLLEDLDEDAQLFSEMDEEIERLSELLKPKLGLPEELFDQVLAEVLAGQPLEPLTKRRKLKKEETVVRVFRALEEPLDQGFALVFETADGLLWQLCDVGLGWSCYREPDPAWTPDEKLNRYLPAKINPRPETNAPWYFDLQFGVDVTLSVRPGPTPGDIRYTLRTGSL